MNDQLNEISAQKFLQRVGQIYSGAALILMIDIKASSDIENNIGNPLAPYLYTVSTMHCETVSLGANGAGLGTVWGRELALEMLATAEMNEIEILDSSNPTNSIYVCRKTRE